MFCHYFLKIPFNPRNISYWGLFKNIPLFVQFDICTIKNAYFDNLNKDTLIYFKISDFKYFDLYRNTF